MAKKAAGPEWARGSRRVIPLNGHQHMYLFTEDMKRHHIAATPEEVERVLEDASPDYKLRILDQLKAEGFLIPVKELPDG